MATKTIKTTVTVGVHDPALDFVRHDIDASGKPQELTVRGLRQVPPGEPVTLEADEADRILARFGGEEVPAEAPAEAQDGDGADPAADAPAKRKRSPKAA